MLSCASEGTAAKRDLTEPVIGLLKEKGGILKLQPNSMHMPSVGLCKKLSTLTSS